MSDKTKGMKVVEFEIGDELDSLQEHFESRDIQVNHGIMTMTAMLASLVNVSDQDFADRDMIVDMIDKFIVMFAKLDKEGEENGS